MHKKNCNCVACKEGLAKFLEKQRVLMEKNGFVAHFIDGDDSCPGNINYHTHGLPKTFNHPDLQICLRMEPAYAEYAFNKCIDQIRKGGRFEIGRKYKGIIADPYELEFIAAVESGRQVLRVIIPDKNNTCDKEPYKSQYTMLSNTD